ncbi:hypothetical protein D9M71_723810 [compost metagenome]
MQRVLMVCAVLGMLAGCAEPPVEQPKANGAYLIIEGREAWAVLVADGKRVEERGTVLDAIHLPKARSPIAASYVIETPNCGRLQGLTGGEGESLGTTVYAVGDEPADLSTCSIRGGLSRMWTALDYSG